METSIKARLGLPKCIISSLPNLISTLKISSVILSQIQNQIKMKAVCVALFALFAVASAGYLSAPVAVAPVLRAAPVVAAVPAYRAAPVLAGPAISYGGVGPVAYGGLGGVYGGGLAYGGPLIG